MWRRLVALSMVAGCQALGTAGTLSPDPAGLQARRAAGIHGLVRDASAAPVPGVRVLAYRPALTAAGRLPAAVAETTTDQTGRYLIAHPPRGVLAIEAISGTYRARLPGVAFGDGVVGLEVGDLLLAPPGSLAGRVTGSALLGTEIELLGTDRLGAADEAGRFVFEDLAPGTYQLRARRPRLISAVSTAVEVSPGARAETPDLLLVPDAPTLLRVEPRNAGPGAPVTVFGHNFGPGSEPLAIAFGAIQVPAERLPDGGARALVPQGARSGPLAVVRDGVASAPIAFPVIASISLSPAYAAALPGERVSLAATVLDTEGAAVGAPALTFAGGGPGWAEAPDGAFLQVSATSGLIHALMVVAGGRATMGTLLGDGTRGDTGDGGPAALARVNAPTAVAAGPDGTVYVADPGAGKIRAVSPDGTVRTVLSGLEAVFALAAGAAGELYFFEGKDGPTMRLVRLAENAVETVATGSFSAVAVGPDGRVATATKGEVRNLGDAAFAGVAAVQCLAFAPDGTLYAGTDTGLIWKVRSSDAVRVAGGGRDRGPDRPALEAALGRISGLAAVGQDLYFVDQTAGRVRKLTPAGRVVTVAGDGFHSYGNFGRFNGDGLALGSSLNIPSGLCALPAGGLAIADTQNHRVRAWRP